MHIAIKRSQHLVVAFQIARILSSAFQYSRLDLAEDTHRAMPNLFPQFRVQFAVERARLGMPAPPQIISQFIEPANTRRHYREDRHAAIDFHECVSFLVLVSSV